MRETIRRNWPPLVTLLVILAIVVRNSWVGHVHRQMNEASIRQRADHEVRITKIEQTLSLKKD